MHGFSSLNALCLKRGTPCSSQSSLLMQSQKTPLQGLRALTHTGFAPVDSCIPSQVSLTLPDVVAGSTCHVKYLPFRLAGQDVLPSRFSVAAPSAALGWALPILRSQGLGIIQSAFSRVVGAESPSLFCCSVPVAEDTGWRQEGGGASMSISDGRWVLAALVSWSSQAR